MATDSGKKLFVGPRFRRIRQQLGLSQTQIAEGLGISGNTVAYHVKQLFLKLDVHDRAGAVAKIASGEGGLRA